MSKNKQRHKIRIYDITFFVSMYRIYSCLSYVPLCTLFIGLKTVILLNFLHVYSSRNFSIKIRSQLQPSKSFHSPPIGSPRGNSILHSLGPFGTEKILDKAQVNAKLVNFHFYASFFIQPTCWSNFILDVMQCLQFDTDLNLPVFLAYQDYLELNVEK